jgi:hypothetical protein
MSLVAQKKTWTSLKNLEDSHFRKFDMGVGSLLLLREAHSGGGLQRGNFPDGGNGRHS